MSPFLKITVSTPKLVAPTRRILCSVEMPPFRTVCHQLYESNIEYEIRYMVDTGVVGCNWIDCPPGWFPSFISNEYVGLASPLMYDKSCYASQLVIPWPLSWYIAPPPPPSPPSSS